MWWQHCKAKWLVEVNENTAFIRRIVAASQIKNAIVEVLSKDGAIVFLKECRSDNEIEAEFVEFYQKLYTKKGG